MRLKTVAAKMLSEKGAPEAPCFGRLFFLLLGP
jgi:hypothetical protein